MSPSPIEAKPILGRRVDLECGCVIDAEARSCILVPVLGAWSDRYRTGRSWNALVAVHALATWFLVGLIWTVHYVHYPLFANVGTESYAEFQAEHVSRIGVVLAVPWIVEGATTLGLLALAARGREIGVVLVGAAAAAGVLLISGLASAPAHAELADGFDPDVHRDLLRWNLVRALLWTVKGVVGGVLLWWALDGSVKSAPTERPVRHADSQSDS